MIPFDLHYVWPFFAYLSLALIPIVLLFWFLFWYRALFVKNFAPSNTFKEVVYNRSPTIFWFKVLMLCVAWIGSILALMQPEGNGHYPEGQLPPPSQTAIEKANLKRTAHDVIFLIDASASMSAKDTRLGTSRLEYAKNISDEISAALKGESASLYAFTSEVTKLSPPTMDYLFVRLMIHDLHINEGDIAGTNLVEALAEMRRQYFSQPSPKLKTLIILSDGGDTEIEQLTGAERQKAIESMLNFLSEAETLNLRVYTIGLGSKEGTSIPDLNYEGKAVTTRLEEDILRKISQRGRGSYYYANEYSPYDLAQDLYNRILQDPPYYDETQGANVLLRSLARGEGLVYDRYYQFPLGIAIFCLGLTLFLPDALRKKEEVLGEAR